MAWIKTWGRGYKMASICKKNPFFEKKSWVALCVVLGGVTPSMAGFRLCDLGQGASVLSKASIHISPKKERTSKSKRSHKKKSFQRIKTLWSVEDIKKFLTEKDPSLFTCPEAIELTGPLMLPMAKPSFQDIHIQKTEKKSDGRFFVSLIHENYPDLPLLKGHVHGMRQVPVLKEGLTPQDVITKEDITWIPCPVTKISSDTCMHPKDLLGKQSRRGYLAPQNPLKKSALVRPVIIEKGDSVTVAVQKKHLYLETTCIAKEKGCLHDRITLINESSKKNIKARVMGPHHAELV